MLKYTQDDRDHLNIIIELVVELLNYIKKYYGLNNATVIIDNLVLRLLQIPVR